METEKTSYTLNHPGDEKDGNKTETYEPLEEDAGETDKMLSKPSVDEPKPVEELPEVNETTALEEKKEAIKDEAQGPAPNVSLKNRFLQLFERKKPESDPSAVQNGNGVEPTVTDVDGTATEPPQAAPKKRFIPIKLQNPFAKKSDNVTPTPEKATAVEASSSDEKKGNSQVHSGLIAKLNYL